MAAVAAAVVIASGSSFAAQAQEASALPFAMFSPSPSPSPSLTAGASPDPAATQSPLPADTVDGDPGLADAPRTVMVEAGDLWFAPNEISISADEPTVLVLSGVGQVAHNLTVDELGLQLYVGPGIDSEVTVSDLPPGTYEFYCSIFGHRRAGMYGTLTVG